MAKLTETQKLVMQPIFMRQFAHFLDEHYPTAVENLLTMEMDYPQIYRTRCAYCGDTMYSDFWGMPIRQKTASGRFKTALIHRCDTIRAEYYSSNASFPYGGKPQMKQRRGAAVI